LFLPKKYQYNLVIPSFKSYGYKLNTVPAFKYHPYKKSSPKLPSYNPPKAPKYNLPNIPLDYTPPSYKPPRYPPTYNPPVPPSYKPSKYNPPDFQSFFIPRSKKKTSNFNKHRKRQLVSNKNLGVLSYGFREFKIPDLDKLFDEVMP